MVRRQLDEERIFHVARDIPDEQLRCDYLKQTCAGDQALRKRVEALLAADEQQTDFLKSVDGHERSTVDHASSIEQAGTTIGRYRLMEQIGEGGMGTVFVAQQDKPIRRKVALKVIKPGMDSKAVIARFEAERQALAMMDHPNIAKVLDAGTTESGRPYFVMELVSGIEITDYCDQRKMSIRERLELFTQVCQAIQHAHQKGIIHRDIKPSNVLVTEQDGKAVPKVIDFGVAKAIGQSLTDRTIYTSFQAVIGTPLYMSPEQAALSNVDVDTRSDVYSLGVLLYELLTGATPFDKETFKNAAQDEVLRMIREQEPPKPSTRISTLGNRASRVSAGRSTDVAGLGKTVRGDLDWVAMKALEKDRNRRYDTANGLALDVKRYLGNEPVIARPPTARYRIQKFYARNRALTATTILIGLALATGLGGALWGLGKANEALFNLQEELINQAFELAFAGDVKAVEDALSKAEQAGASREQCETILGIGHIYAGDADKAVTVLDKVVKENQDDLAAVCAASWANMRASRYDESGRLYARIGRLAKMEEVDDHALLLLAQVKVYGTRDVQGMIDDLDALIDRHPRWGIAYANRARAKAQRFAKNRSFELARSAAEDAVHANRLLYNNPFILGVTLEVYAEVIELARLLGQDAKPFERYADDIAELVSNWDDDLQARHRRLIYYRVVDHDDYQSEEQKLFDDDWSFPQPQLARLLQENAPTRLHEFANQNESHRACQISLAIQKVIDGDPDGAIEMHDELQRKTDAFNTRLLMLDIPSLAQRPDLVKKAAKEMLASLPDHDPAHYWDFEVICTRYLAEPTEMTDLKLLESAGPFLAEQAVAHYFIGMRAFAEGEVTKARHHLQMTAETSPPGWWCDVFAETYVTLIDQERLPLRVDRAENLTPGKAPK